MSLIAAHINELTGNIHLAADTYNYHYGGRKNIDSPKLFSFDVGSSKIAIGTVGAFADKMAFQDYLADVGLGTNNEFGKRINVVNLMAGFRLWKDSKKYPDNKGTTFLIACPAGLFTYRKNAELIEHKEYTAIGVGAIAAIALMNIGWSPDDAVGKCIEICHNVGGEVITEEIRRS